MSRAPTCAIPSPQRQRGTKAAASRRPPWSACTESGRTLTLRVIMLPMRRSSIVTPLTRGLTARTHAAVSWRRLPGMPPTVLTPTRPTRPMSAATPVHTTTLIASRAGDGTDPSAAVVSRIWPHMNQYEMKVTAITTPREIAPAETKRGWSVAMTHPHATSAITGPQRNR